MEKVVLFTHGIDIDGFACAVLGKLAFKDIQIVFCDNFDIDDKIKEFDKLHNLSTFDKIYIADHCPTYEFCLKLQERKDILSKIRVFDHHESRIKEQGTLDWIDLVVENRRGKCCGASLFYNYLVESNLLQASLSLNNFVELTRIYDTWEWQYNKFGAYAYKLNVLFLALGRDGYIKRMLKKIRNNEVGLSQEDMAIVDHYLDDFFKQVREYADNIMPINYNGIIIGYVEIDDRFKNDMAREVISRGNPDNLDCLLMPVKDRASVSLRSVKPECDVSVLAKSMGGGGHTGAASVLKSDLPEIFSDLLTNQNNV